MPTIKLEQTAWLRGKQSFEIRDNEDVVRVANKFRGNLNEFQIPLNIIHPDPNYFQHYNIAGVVCMILFGVLSLLMIVLSFRQPPLLMFLIFFLPLFFAGLVQFKRMSVTAQIFRSRLNGQNLLVIWRELPTKSEFDLFINSFQEKLKKVQVPIVGPASQSVADEIRKLGDLKKDGLISEKEFEEAKARLLDSLEKREIGFK